MDAANPPSATGSLPLNGDMKAIPYDQTKPDKPPIPVKHALSLQPLPPVQSTQSGGANPSDPLNPATKFGSHLEENVRRDSGLAPSSLTAKDSRTTLTADDFSAASLTSAPSIPQIRIDEERSRSTRKPSSKLGIYKSKKPQNEGEPKMETPFQGITLDIPTSSFDDISPEQMKFSKRGSMLVDGMKSDASNKTMNGAHRIPSRRPKTAARPALPHPKLLSADEEQLSQKVRSMYEMGVEDLSESRENLNSEADGEEALGDDLVLRDSNSSLSVSRKLSNADVTSNASFSGRRSAAGQAAGIVREDNELAGGLEDWQDVEGGDVDRYGFILPRTSTSGTLAASTTQASPGEPPRLQRISTSLQLATETPRRKHTIRRTPSNARSAKSGNEQKLARQPSKRSNRPASSQGSLHGSIGGGPRLRYAANRLPHNKDRRLMDEAGDMLTLPPGRSDTLENDDSPAARELKKKEWQREEKWRKMAKIASKDAHGGGMIFTFDVHNPKLVERTWKGIPDRWRATAWYSFLSASAKKAGSPSDQELVQVFNECQDQGSPDDVQIDIDVPRTISSHIMFRRRYRGGQRLLFRVLHAMSLYFPETGYVQGMAALAATLLAYYDEENSFVMMVRLWQHRGLGELYKSGFEGLMDALDDFEKHWLAGGEIGAKLSQLGITPTAYGTRWYLTLFNYSIPFPAQLRVWDVFMLLGDRDERGSLAPGFPPSRFGKTLDVLHATSAALIDGTREILLESDFENVMKVLTSWVPIKDEELFMRVAKAEWKMHRRKS